MCWQWTDGYQRLLCVSAGNTPLDGRHHYPNYNHVHGVEDPAQSWNVLTVGAYTERAVIQSEHYRELATYCKTWAAQSRPAEHQWCGVTNRGLSSRILSWKVAIAPLTHQLETLIAVDDLSLLTTRVAPTGALLTTTGDTSAATALAARYAAIIYAHYPTLWPETIRGLLIHSARWTAAMLSGVSSKPTA